MSQPATTIQSTIDVKLTHETVSLNPSFNDNILGVLPKSKIKIENLSKEPGIFKFNIDFAKLDHEDILAFFDCLLSHAKKIQCLDLRSCNLLGHQYAHITETIAKQLHSLSNSSQIQKFMISPNSSDQKPLALTNNNQRLILLETQLNSDILSDAILNEFLKRDGVADTERQTLIPETILDLKFSSRQKAAFLYPWQKPNIYGTNPSPSLADSQKIFTSLKELITDFFPPNSFCSSIFISAQPTTLHSQPYKKKKEVALFAYCESELKKILENKTREADDHRLRFALETLTWLGLVIRSVQSSSTKYRWLGEQAEKAISDCIQDILNSSEISTKIKMLQIFQRNFIYGITHANPDHDGTHCGFIMVNHFRFLQFYLITAKERRKGIALLLTDLCRNSEKPEVNPGIHNLSTDVIAFFNNPLYREGVYNRIVINVLLKLGETSEISDSNKVLLILHCQKILRDKPKDKSSHYKTWSLTL